ncbi:insecticidal delta-endotoxin Cry8Ea1 family protein, partial [Bacillus wiedmannii]|uniref:insecticidal delta-endotoxin Cry8Ea1 family protein n=1 Tax=Bacillus wiedmannii TaxID=1890302 RepID=UPI0018DEB317
MNQNNNTEYEIIDASTNRTNKYHQYPLVNEPKASMQNTNYKDWLNLCEGNSTGGPSQLSARSALSTGTSIVSTILGFFGASGVVGEVAGLLFSISDIFWPEGEGSDQDTWKQLITHVEDLINKTINTDVLQRATSELDGLKQQIAAYHRALEVWERTPHSRSASEVISRFRITSLSFVGAMPKFKQSGSEILLLSVYAQAANLHLLLMRDAAIFGSRWGLPSDDIQLYQREQEKYTKDYTNHCITWYREGADQFKTSNQWVNFNRYRRDMTLTVLDIIALFPLYDAQLYPMGVKSELTREIYSDVINGEAPLATDYYSFDKNEADYIRSPHTFTWLYGLDFYSDYIRDGSNNPWGNAFIGGRNRYRYTNIDSGGYSSSWLQQSATTKTVSLSKNTYIYGLSARSFKYTYPAYPTYLTSIDFNKTDNSSISLSAGGVIAGRETVATYFDFLLNKEGTGPATYNDYSHILSYTWGVDRGVKGYIFSFTHSSVDPENSIVPNKITQIPAIKATDSGLPSVVVLHGPGYTGGDLVRLKGIMDVRVKIIPTQSFAIRIKYASNYTGTLTIRVSQNYETYTKSFNIDQTFSGDDNYYGLNPEDFAFADTTYILTNNRPSDFVTIGFDTFHDGRPVVIDKIEFIPIQESVLEYEGRQNLEKAQKAVDDLFTNAAKNTLKTETMDYDIDQAATLVECVSEELDAKEKMILLDEVKCAKYLSQSRNVLKNGDFESETLGWTTSNNITIQADNPIFKGNYLHMSGARDIDGTVFPTYVYQKIDESKLKPYTRYRVRGFVGSSKELELVVSRYGEEIDAIMNVPNNLVNLNPPASDCGDWNRCDNTSFTNGYVPVTSSPCQYDGKKRHVVCHDRHQFDFHIDTGSVDPNENIGIWVLFKVSSPDGYATLDNLEVIEEELLVGETLARVKHMEKKWIHQMEAKRYETQQAYDTVKQAIDALFINEQEEALQFDTTLAQIQYADSLVQSVPYVYNDWLSDVPGMNYDMYIELVSRVAQARYLYDARNVLKNGDFTEGLKGWHVTGNAEVQQRDGVSVLVLSNWSEGVAQNVHVQHNHGYVLRVTAKKEGHGKGYITLMDCEDNQETL